MVNYTRLYPCFVDFRGAFDLIWHDGLYTINYLSTILEANFVTQ